jgi:hypothetical protein
LLSSVSTTTQFCGLDLPQLLEKCNSEDRRGICADLVLALPGS